MIILICSIISTACFVWLVVSSERRIRKQRTQVERRIADEKNEFYNRLGSASVAEIAMFIAITMHEQNDMSKWAIDQCYKELDRRGVKWQ